MQRSVQSNIWKYGLFMTVNLKVFIAILGAYFLTIPDVGPQGVGLILLVSSLIGAFLEIPSGYISDKIGHKRALVLSQVFAALGAIIYIFATNIYFLVAAATSLALAYALKSGTGEAFIQETLEDLGRGNGFAEVVGKLRSISLIVSLAASSLVPFLVPISYKLPFVVALVLNIVGLITALSFVKPCSSEQSKDIIRFARVGDALRDGMRLGFIMPALFVGLITGILIAFDWFRAPYQEFVGAPVIYFGLFFGGGRLLASLISAYSGRIKKKFSARTFFAMETALFGSFILALGFVTSPWWIIGIFLVSNGIRHGVKVVNTSHIVDRLGKSPFKATLLSIHAQVETLVYALLGFGVGFLAERMSYPAAFIALGVFSIFVLTPIVWFTDRRQEA